MHEIAEQIARHINVWQTLYGTFFGSSFTLLFYFYTEWRKEKRNLKQEQYKIYRTIIYCINSASDFKTNILNFNADTLDPLISELSITGTGAYKLTRVHFPDGSVPETPNDLIKISSGSAYIDSEIGHLIHLTQDFQKQAHSLAKMLIDTCEDNKEIALTKINTPDAQNLILKNNLVEYKKLLDTTVIKNINTYIEIAARASVSMKYLYDKGFGVWRFKFRKSFKYFRNMRDYNDYCARKHEYIRDFFKDRCEKLLLEIEKKRTA